MRVLTIHARRWRQLVLGLVCGVGLLSRPDGAVAQGTGTPDLAFDVVPLLGQIVGSSLIELNGYQDRLELTLPVPLGGRLVSAELRLNLVNAKALDLGHSRVTAEINGHAIGDLPLRNDGELSRVTLPLPRQMFQAAGNRLVLTSELRTHGPCDRNSVRDL